MIFNFRNPFSLILFLALVSQTFPLCAQNFQMYASRDTAVIEKWERDLVSVKEGKILWYRSFQNFVALDYRERMLEESSFFSCLIQELTSKELQIGRGYCVYGYCRADIFKEKIPDALQVIQHLKSQMNTWEYKQLYACNVIKVGKDRVRQEFKRGDEFVTELQEKGSILWIKRDGTADIELSDRHGNVRVNRLLKSIPCIENICVNDTVILKNQFEQTSSAGSANQSVPQTAIVKSIFPNGLIEIDYPKDSTFVMLSGTALHKKCSETGRQLCTH